MPGAGGIGTPEQVRAHLEAYDKVGMDQMIFVQQHGKNRHEHICECLGLFASEIMPRFKAAEPEREARKAEELAPWIEAALARKPRMEMPDDEDLPVIKSMARALEDAGQSPGNAYVDPTRGGGIPLPRQEPVAPPGDE